MPEICRFCGIVVQMYADDHVPPHFHARYAGREAAIAIDAHLVLSGSLPPRALALTIKWSASHTRELMADWELAKARLPLSKIAPLD
ncbi:MAG: DUF4160 domain-containing protein [Candidatus Limnocylindrales bacterium]